MYFYQLFNKILNFLVEIDFLILPQVGRASFLPALMFPNVGNMGLPLCLFAFGERGLALGIAFFTVAAAVQFTVVAPSGYTAPDAGLQSGCTLASTVSLALTA